MPSHSQIRSITQKLRLYPYARAIYRRLHPEHRRDRLANRRFYCQIVGKGDLCFDIGANVGQTIEALTDIGAKVVAVEPNPNCIPVLNYQFSNCDRVTLLRKAIGAEPGTARLHFTGTESTASIREDWPFSTDQTIEVEVVTLDSLIASYGRPNFIKVDVEGFELEVFKGLSQPVPLIYFEMHGREIQFVQQILDRLGAIGEITGVNAVDAANSNWLIDEWVPVDRFICSLGEPPPHRANVVVKMRL